MNLYDLKWSPSEKKIARSAYDSALESALAKIITEFKSKAEAVRTPSGMWEIEDYLRQKRREIDDLLPLLGAYFRLCPSYPRRAFG